MRLHVSFALGQPLGMTILDTAGRNVSEGLEQKHAADLQPAENRCGMLLPAARSPRHLPEPLYQCALVFSALATTVHGIGLVSIFGMQVWASTMLKTPLIFYWNTSKLSNFATTYPKLKYFFRPGRCGCAYL